MIILFRGTGPIAAGIRWQTRGAYAHSAWMFGDGSCVESHGRSGVVHVESPWFKNDGVADVYSIRCLTGGQIVQIQSYLLSQVGAGYDWLGIVRFLSGVNRDNTRRWFCSELVAEACELAGRPLMRADAWRLSPTTLSWSTELVPVKLNATFDWWLEKFGK